MDGCTKADVPNVINFIEKKLSYNKSDLKLVLSTHSHPDHAGGLHSFRKLGIPIAGPNNIGIEYSGFGGAINYLIDILLSYLVAFNKKKSVKNIFFNPKIKLDYVLEENSPIPEFEGWVAIEAPGHTNRDLTIFHKKTRTAYVADNFVGSAKSVYRPYPITSPKKYKATLKKYKQLGIENFLLAHSGLRKVTHEEIDHLIYTAPRNPRVHKNTIMIIFLKLFHSLIKKIRSVNSTS